MEDNNKSQNQKNDSLPESPNLNGLNTEHNTTHKNSDFMNPPKMNFQNSEQNRNIDSIIDGKINHRDSFEQNPEKENLDKIIHDDIHRDTFDKVNVDIRNTIQPNIPNHSTPLQSITPKSQNLEKNNRKKLSKALGISGCLLSFILFVCIIIPALVWISGFLPSEWEFLNISNQIDKQIISDFKLREAICIISPKDSLHYKNLSCEVIQDNINTTNNSNSSSVSSQNSQNTNSGEIALRPQNLDEIKNSENAVLSIVERIEDSVVTVVATSQIGDSYFLDQTDENSQNIGSGFIIREDGLIVTNSHVVADENLSYSVIIKNEKNAVSVEKIYRDPVNDIAFLKINLSGLKALPLGDSDSLKKGQFAMAIGSPLGDLTGTITTGIISGLNREVVAGDEYSNSTKKFVGVIQTDAAINPGNSGGPLINSSAEVIGINFATSRGDNNISFALPISRVKLKLDEFVKYQRFLQPYIGVGIQQGRYYTKNQVLYGALVNRIIVGSPAEAAGIKVKDLILKVDNESLEEKSFTQIIQSKSVGDKIKLEIWRNGEKITIEVEVKDNLEN